MHLKQLKLAGFKSFVDPTIVPFPSQLVAVVGPNGCGKSNIIDAVRWVMGESSAKNLRGESMTDVIFNGSSHRKAVGQASIELVFDNSMGRLIGPYASYQEIVVKRVVTRDGDSAYFLNGSRCRRRDITDIFLGTGAGARGYSIIGQGTISRLIEARPEELRAYLEEAAGVSKYKERRRETLSRIEHTRENLARVADIREELDKQLQRLERQAKAAERYKFLRAEERLYRAEILALRWQTLTQEQQAKQFIIKQLLVDYEQHQAKAAEAYKESTSLREKLHEENERFQEVQASFYQLATDIARLEESIQQQQREKQRLKVDQQQLQSDWQLVNGQLEQDKENLLVGQALLEELQEKVTTQQIEFEEKQNELAQTQEQQTSWNLKTQQLQAELNKALREKEVAQIGLQHLNERRQQLMSRLEKINDEINQVELSSFAEVLNQQQETLLGLKQQLEADEDRYQQSQAIAAQLREGLTETEKQLRQAQDQLYRLNTQQAGLVAAQQSALGTVPNQAELSSLWAKQPRLVEAIQVEKEWQFACELVLADGLEAIVLDSFDGLWTSLESLQGKAVFLTNNQMLGTEANYPRLSEKIKGFHPNWITQLDKIYTAASLKEALLCLAKLNDDESVITPQGCWLGKGWVRVAAKETKNQVGLLLRQEELSKVNEALILAQDDLVILREKRDHLHQELSINDEETELAKEGLSASRDALRACEVDISHNTRFLEQAEVRKNSLADENETLRYDLEELATQQQGIELQLASAAQAAARYEAQQHELHQDKSGLEEALVVSRRAVEMARTELHHSQLQQDREKVKCQQLRETIARETLRLEILNERLEGLATHLMTLETPDTSLQAVLEEKIARHIELEADLSLRREQLAQLTSTLESFESLVRSEEKLAKQIQETSQQEQMQEQALALRAGGVLESLSELDADVDAVLAAIPTEMTQEQREWQMQETLEKIKRLGAINLAAIEEYDTEFQRKQHLDEQYQDLMEALTTLDAAIEKMDKETQQRLRITFDEVNRAFQSLFPRLFGGGRAMLELTCDNLLEAGVVVMAQPPGKRNSTIHLLSGGEKAMTAVALVFAIFQLNPSPFCMLDEVDAPLDDVNVGRFCALVKEMSQFVQFLFITHNKVTMELADHLIGVTMCEPGVSRVVAVDVEQALSMTES